MNFKIEIEEYKNDSFFRRITNAKPLMKELSLMGLSAIQKNIESNISPKNAPLTQTVKKGDKTLRDIGTLRKSLKASHSESVAEIGTNCPYAKIHNPVDGRKETVITPKKAKSLALPASAYTRTLFRRYGWSPREVIAGLESDGHSVYRPYKKGGGSRANVIMAKKGKGNAKAIFILVKKVKIPARPFMYLSDDVISEMEKRTEEYYLN